MELEKARLLSSINNYYSIRVSPIDNLKAEVNVFTGVKDMVKSQKRYDVEIFKKRDKYTTMGGKCTCLRPQQNRIPCVHLIYFAKTVNYPLNNLFREEHTTKYWKWQYAGMSEEWKIPDLSNLDSCGDLVPPIIGAPRRGRPKKGKRKKSFLEMRKKKIKN